MSTHASAQLAPFHVRAGMCAIPKPSFPVNADAFLSSLLPVGIRRRFARNETIYGEGESARFIYRVVTGAVRKCRHMPDGRRQIMEFRLAGEFFGLLETEEYMLTAEALGDTVVIAYPRSQIARLGDENPELRHYLSKMLCARFVASQNHLVMLGRQTAQERLASFLVELIDHNHTDDGDMLELPMNRQDIADYLGLTIETVCRLLSAMKRQRLVTIPDLHHLQIADVEALRDLSLGEDVE